MSSNWDTLCEEIRNLMELHGTEIKKPVQMQCSNFDKDQYKCFRSTIIRRVIKEPVLITTTSKPKIDAFSTMVDAKNVLTVSFGGKFEQPFGHSDGSFSDRESYTCARDRLEKAKNYVYDNHLNVKYIVVFENGIMQKRTRLDSIIFKDLCDVIIYDMNTCVEYSTKQVPLENMLTRDVPYDVMVNAALTNDAIGVPFAQLYSDVDWMQYSGLSRADQIADSLSFVLDIANI